MELGGLLVLSLFVCSAISFFLVSFGVHFRLGYQVAVIAPFRSSAAYALLIAVSTLEFGCMRLFGRECAALLSSLSACVVRE